MRRRFPHPAFELRILLALILFTAALRAQVGGAISGRVEDGTGAPISGVAVKVKSLETSASRTTTTDAAGNYRFLSLPLGPQEVSAEKTGFKLAVRTGIHLAVGQEAVVNVQLAVGPMFQTVTVSEEVPLVNTTTSSVSGLVGERQIKDLPLNGRSFDPNRVDIWKGYRHDWTTWREMLPKYLAEQL